MCRFFYLISDTYNATFSNNTIYCYVIGFNKSTGSKIVDYKTSITFNFTTVGSNGTDYTLSIVAPQEQTAVTRFSPLVL
jgi:hypothetical protein